MPVHDTLFFHYRDDIQRFKIAIDAYYIEEITMESNSSHHKITASIEHYYKKYTSSLHHIIYHLYVIATTEGKSDVMKFTIMDKKTEEIYEVGFTLYEDNLESGFPLISKCENMCIANPLCGNDTTYYFNHDDFNWFLIEYESLLNYSFKRKNWIYGKP